MCQSPSDILGPIDEMRSLSKKTSKLCIKLYSILEVLHWSTWNDYKQFHSQNVLRTIIIKIS